MRLFRLSLLCCYACCCCFAIIACQSSDNSTASRRTYFSLQDFFAQQIHFHEQQKTKLQKKVSINRQSETQQLSQPNWQQELDLFSQADINKTAWIDSYQKDSTLLGHVWQIRYTALDPKLRTQQINIARQEQQIQSIVIDKQVDNVFYRLIEQLKYTPKGYEIYSIQKIALQKADTLHIQATFESH